MHKVTDKHLVRPRTTMDGHAAAGTRQHLLHDFWGDADPSNWTSEHALQGEGECAESNNEHPSGDRPPTSDTTERTDLRQGKCVAGSRRGAAGAPVACRASGHLQSQVRVATLQGHALHALTKHAVSYCGDEGDSTHQLTCGRSPAGAWGCRGIILSANRACQGVGSIRCEALCAIELELGRDILRW
jgi:hypothetical protein